MYNDGCALSEFFKIDFSMIHAQLNELFANADRCWSQHCAHSHVRHPGQVFAEITARYLNSFEFVDYLYNGTHSVHQLNFISWLILCPHVNVQQRFFNLIAAFIRCALPVSETRFDYDTEDFDDAQMDKLIAFYKVNPFYVQKVHNTDAFDYRFVSAFLLKWRRKPSSYDPFAAQLIFEKVGEISCHASVLVLLRDARMVEECAQALCLVDPIFASKIRYFQQFFVKLSCSLQELESKLCNCTIPVIERLGFSGMLVRLMDTVENCYNHVRGFGDPAVVPVLEDCDFVQKAADRLQVGLPATISEALEWCGGARRLSTEYMKTGSAILGSLRNIVFHALYSFVCLRMPDLIALCVLKWFYPGIEQVLPFGEQIALYKRASFWYHHKQNTLASASSADVSKRTKQE